MTEHEAKTLSVPDAGRIYFGLGRGASYEAARRGELPVIRIGRLLRVPVVAVERMLTNAAPRSITADHPVLGTASKLTVARAAGPAPQVTHAEAAEGR